MRYWPYVLIIATACLMMALFWQGPNLTFDDANYIHYAQLLTQGKLSFTSSPYSYGLGYIALVALALPFPALLNAIEYIAILLICYQILTRYFDKDAAFIGAICAAIAPFMFIYATRILPDMSLGLIFSLVFLIYAYKPQSTKWAFAAGLLAGSSIFIKFGGFVLLMLLMPIWALALLAFAAILGLGLDYKPRLCALILGIILMLGAYQLLSPVSIHYLAQTYSQVQVNLAQTTWINNIGTMLDMGNLIGYGFMSGQVFPIGILFILAVFGTAIIIWERKKTLYFALVAFWLGWLYLFFGTESFSSYALITIVDRYLIPFLPPMLILGTMAIQKLMELRPRYRLGMALGIIGLAMLLNLPVYHFFALHHFINYTITKAGT
ncbi:MAG: glycosyltransferase family 39 protein [Candidatus Micrarchaeota archaeon]|nr:glycosyltransferase family 39 protein [Candidatus Micrarchaeota archaeon]